jgi:putative intracellular protease/amidase
MQIAIALYPGFTVLDAIGPYQVFSELADAETIVCAERRGRLDDEDRQLHFDIEHTFDEITWCRADAPPPASPTATGR